MIRPVIVAASLNLALAGCNAVPAGLTATGGLVGSVLASAGLAGNALAVGQLVCYVDSAYIAVFDPVGSPVTVTGQSADYVANICRSAGLNATPVALPAGAVATPTTVALPARAG